MSSPNGHVPDPAAEDRIVELLAAYDESLAEDYNTPLTPPLDSFEPEAIERIERVQLKLRRLRRLRDSVLDTQHATAQGLTTKVEPTSDPGRDERSPSDRTDLPKTLGRFEIVRELGAGGSGVVLLAQDPVLNRLVALKIPRPEVLFLKDLRHRFIREAQAAARLKHPNLVSVYEAGEAGTVCYIASTYCDGPNLSVWLKEQSGPVPPATAARIVTLLADAIDYAHNEGVLHRDLKPSNVLLDPLTHETSDGASSSFGGLPFSPKVTDFGLAKLLASDATETRTGVVMGTLSYMAPEQADTKRGPIGRQADVYGLGAILYELLTGLPPFRGQTDAETLQQLLAADCASPGLLRPNLPRDLGAVCLKCLEKNPRLRYETAAALAADLRNFLSGNPTAARSLTSAQRLVKWTRRRPALAALLAVSVAATLGFVVLTSMYIARLATAREAAEVSRAGAEESAKTAESQEQLASRFMYASEMRNAYEAIGNGAAAQAEQLLQKYQPGSRFASLRGFEWYHLRSRVHGEQSTLRGHRGQVYAVAFQPDGRVLASGAEDGSIKFWNPLDAAELASLSAHTNCVNALAYSPDGQILVSGSCDHKIKVWQATTHELLATLEGHPDNVRCLAISPDGRLLASGGNDPAVRVWDLATRKLLKSCDTESTTVDSVAWRNDSRSLVMVASKVIDRGKCRILLWNIERDNPISLVDAASNIPILPIGSDIYLGSTNGHIQVIDERGLVQMELPIGHTSGATALASSSSGNWLASGYADAAVCIWGRDKQRFKQSLTGHTGRVQSLAFSPTRDLLLASASFDGTVKLWDIQRDSMPRVVVDCVKGSIADSQHPTAISPDLRYVAYRRSADRVEVVDIDGNRLPITDATTGAACAPFPESVTLGLDFLPGDQPVLFGIPNPNGMLSSWNVTQGTFLEAIPKSPLRPAQNIIFSSNGRHLICTTPASVAISDMQTGETWCRLEMPANHSEPSVVRWPYVVFSPDRETLAVSGIGDLQTVTWLIDLHAKRCRSPIPRATIAVCDQAKLIAVNQTHSIVLVDPTSGSERFVLWHDADLSCVAFSPDARTLAAATVDGRVYLWHVPTGGALTQLEMGSVAFVKLQFSRDNRKLAALAKDYGPGDTATMKFFVWEGVDGP